MNPDLKLIRHNVAQFNIPDDPSYPFRLDATFRQAEFMIVTAVLLYGPTEIVQVRGKTRAALETFVAANKLESHPRLIKLEITQPEQAAKVSSL